MKPELGSEKAPGGDGGKGREVCPPGVYFTTSQLARRWGVSAVTIIRLIEQGELSGLKIRGCYRISRRSIEKYESRVAF
ncbi:MAG: helix-turn-helix domain-containing protein [Candidatus Nitrospinota bacterium M3_3B_026]